MNLHEAIESLNKQIADPSLGLPEELFLFVSRITPLVNVDLLIKNEQGQTLLTWRDDGYWAPGWHVPGGIIRYKETMADRVKAAAKKELGAEVEFDPVPLAVNECIIKSRKDRGHFISFLYRCKLTTPLDESLRCDNSKSPKPDQWLWHDSCPDNMIEVHEMYRRYI